MATNADTDDTSTTAVDDSDKVTEEDLRRVKYGNDDVETSKEADEIDETDETDESSEEASEDDGQTDDEATDDTSEEDSTDDSDDDASDQYVKEFPNIKGDTLEDYARSLEDAYKNSTTEAIRLKKENDELKTGKGAETSDDTQAEPLTVEQLYIKQQMEKEVNEAYADFSKTYPQVNDPSEFNQFSREVEVLAQSIRASQNRIVSAAELYSKAAVILGWEPEATTTKPTGKEKVGMALKGRAAITKTSSGPKKSTPTSKVTQAMILTNRKMYPNKTDAEIREELEPYV